MNKSITVQAFVDAPLEKVWEMWTLPQHITGWCFASSDWECPRAENDLRAGGVFTTVMSAKDGSAGFDFGGTYTRVEPLARISYEIGDGRKVDIVFAFVDGKTSVTETFDMEDINSEELQRKGWMSILQNFKSYVEKN